MYVKRPKEYLFFGQAILSLRERIQGVKKNAIIAKMACLLYEEIGNSLKITGELGK